MALQSRKKQKVQFIRIQYYVNTQILNMLSYTQHQRKNKFMRLPQR